MRVWDIRQKLRENVDTVHKLQDQILSVVEESYKLIREGEGANIFGSASFEMLSLDPDDRFLSEAMYLGSGEPNLEKSIKGLENCLEECERLYYKASLISKFYATQMAPAESPKE